MTDLQSFFAWWFIVTLLGLVTWPITFRLFYFLPDRGYSLTKTAGLLAVGYVGWLLGNFQLAAVDPGGVIVALLVVGAVSLAAGRGLEVDPRRWLFDNRWYLLIVEVLFITAFGLWAAVRAYNPTITATEKPMEFAFLNSVLRTGLQPPGDPWLAGYAISYYHFGYVLMGMLTALSGVTPGVAFNLGIALLFGLTAQGAFGIVLNLIAAAMNADKPSAPTSLATAAFPALLGPLFMLMGNLNGAMEIAHRQGMFAVDPAQLPAYTACPAENRYCVICEETLPPECKQAPYRNHFWGWLDIKWTNDPPLLSATNTGGEVAPARGWVPDRFLWWWQSSRVIHDRDLFGVEVEVIDEFPFFSFLLGDMHPHVLGLPFVFLGIAFGLTLFLKVRAGNAKVPVDTPEAPFLKRIWNWVPLDWPDLLGGAIILGGLSFLNTWDFPIYLFVTAAAYAMARATREGWLNKVWRDALVLGVSLASLGVILYLPFYLGFRSQLGGILPNLIFGSRVQQFIVMFGLWLFVLFSFLGWLAVKRSRQSDWTTGISAGVSILVGLILIAVLLSGAIFALFRDRPEVMSALEGLVGRASLQEAPGLILQRRLEIERVLTPLLLAAILAVAAALAFGSHKWASSADPAGQPRLDAALDIVPFALVLMMTGALLTLGPEFVYLRDLFNTRMNTVFKFYYQAWVVWVLAAAFGSWLLLRWATPVGRMIYGLGLAAVIVLGLIYPTLATATITDNWRGTTFDAEQKPYPTLDGMAYMRTNHRQADYEAIQFINTTIKGRPVIAEAVGGSYTEYGRVSAHTGLPTVIGWPFHEQQWRGDYSLFDGREGDVRTLYETNNWEQAAAILDKYNVKYVYVGPMEFSQYPQLNLQKFDAHLGKIYEAEGVIIYEYKGGS